MIVLRILLWLLLLPIGLVLFLLLIVSAMRLKIDLHLKEDGEMFLRGGVGPVMLTLSPKKEKKPVDLTKFTYAKHQKRLAKEQRAAEKKAARAEKKRAKKESQKEEEMGTEEPKKKLPIKLILALVRYALHEIPFLFHRFHIEIRALHLTVGGKDAAAVGKSYGILSQSVPYLLLFLEKNTSLKPIPADAVSVKADFLSEKTTVEVDLRLRLRILTLLRIGGHTLIWFIRRQLSASRIRFLSHA